MNQHLTEITDALGRPVAVGTADRREAHLAATVPGHACTCGHGAAPVANVRQGRPVGVYLVAGAGVLVGIGMLAAFAIAVMLMAIAGVVALTALAYVLRSLVGPPSEAGSLTRSVFDHSERHR